MAKQKVNFTETALRDASQSLIATRLSYDKMEPILATMDKAGYYSVECWGGATFDSCLRYLNEDPWERLRNIRKNMPNTKLQMLLRGQNLLGYKHYHDDVVEKFVELSIKNGIDVIRIFDALNDFRNIKTALEALGTSSQAVADKVDALNTTVGTGLGNIEAKIDAQTGKIETGYTDLSGKLGTIGTNILNGFNGTHTDLDGIKAAINGLKDQLKKVDRQMSVQRSNRGQMVRLALVGYTNVGKSTLMNLLAKSDVFAENKLFATLDTTVRKVVIENVPFLLSDTVGFIRKLPTQLIEAFKSTLDEVREADILLHVVDISAPDFEDQMKTVEKTLKDIGAANKPVYVIFNKTDAYSCEPYDEFSLEPKGKENLTLEELRNSWIAREKTPCIFISAKNRTGIEKLRDDIYKMVSEIHAGRYPFNNFLY